jgi:formylmethanofuran dehydrogenase subunit E
MRSFLTTILLLVIQFASAQNPSMEVLDTNFSKGSLNNKQTITLNDVVKFHGHLCDGLVVGFLGAKEALYKLYPDGLIDRTNTRIISKSSPCLTDVAIYLTGGRYQFNTFFVSDSINYIYIIQRISDGKAFGVKLKPGIKPKEIDSLGNLANDKKLNACELKELRKLEEAFSKKMLDSNPIDDFMIEEIFNFSWKPQLQNNFTKTDILNKDVGTCH